MPTAKAYGSITIVDIGDIGTLSAQPESNQPTTIIYNKDLQTYYPDWNQTPYLQLTPVSVYGGIDLTADDVSVKWFYRDDTMATGEWTELTPGFTLTVNSVPFTEDITLITYKCEVTYREPNSDTSLTAAGQITFTKVIQSMSIAFCTITGPDVIKYDNQGNVLNNGQISLTANLTNCGITKWEWWSDATNKWQTITDSTGLTIITTATITALLNSSPYSGATKWIFKVHLKHDENAEKTFTEEHTIVKLSDGADSSFQYAIKLDKEDFWVSADDKGVFKSGAFPINCNFAIYNGAENISGSNLISFLAPGGSVTVQSNVPTYNSETKMYTYTITSWNSPNNEAAELIINASVKRDANDTNPIQLFKSFTMTKVIPGLDGSNPTKYDIEANHTLIVRNNSRQTYNVREIELTAYRSSFDAEGVLTRSKVTTSDEIDFWYKRNGKDANLNKVTSTSAGVGKISWLHTDVITSIDIYVTSHGASEFSSATLFDQDSISIVHDGTDALTVTMSNPNENIPCSSQGVVLQNYTVSIPFSVYSGTSEAKVSGIEKPSDTDLYTITLPANLSAGLHSGTINIQFNKDQTILGNGGSLSFTFNVINPANSSQTIPITQVFSYNASLSGAVTPVVLISPGSDGFIINGTSEEAILISSLSVDSAPVAGAEYKWFYYDIDEGEEKDVEDAPTGYTLATTTYTNDTLKIHRDAIHNFVSITAQIKYNDTDYKAYQRVEDWKDPLTIVVLSSLGDKIMNSQGYGGLYARLEEHEIEQDALGNNFTLWASTSTIDDYTFSKFPQVDDRYFYVQKITGINLNKATLYKCKIAGSIAKPNGEWEPDDTEWTYEYKWSFADRNGNPTAIYPQQPTGVNDKQTNIYSRFLFIDADRIDKKTIFNLTVTKK